MGAARLWTVAFDILHTRGFPSPCVIDQQLCLNAKEVIEEILIVTLIRLAKRTACDIAHRIETVFLELPCVTSSNPPKVCERTMRPKLSPVAHFIQFCDPNAVGIRRDMFCYDVHRDLSKVEIWADSCCRRDARLPQNIADEADGERMRRDPLCL